MIERMRNVSQKLIFKMGKEGKLVLSVVTYNVESKVTFNDLTVIGMNMHFTFPYLFIRKFIALHAFLLFKRFQ